MIKFDLAKKIDILLITYYWPPAGGGGVQRWLKMSKYLVDFPCNIIIYTPENPEYPVIDQGGLEDVDQRIKILKHPISEPYALYKKLTGKQKEEKIYSGFINDKTSILQKLSVWIRGNFFIPDARKYWIKPSIKFLSNYMNQYSIDVVITTGPPHSMHMIGMGLKKKFTNIKWVVDFRDPWTNIDFYNQLMLSKRADKKHHRLEKEVLSTADKVVTVGWTLAKELSNIRNKDDIEVITNGYDFSDFNKEVELEQQFNITHIGSINEDRNPITLWKTLATLGSDKPHTLNQIKVELIGQIDESVKRSVEEYNLQKVVTFDEYIPHDQAIRKIMSSHALLLIINNTQNAEGILTGKLFEYLGSKKANHMLRTRKR